MSIYVCDSIMGSGKTSACINYMNENSDKKFIFITPYLDESDRIKRCCPMLNFTEPSNKIPEHHFSKVNHTAELIKEGRNISTTHQAFKHYDQDMLDDIKKQEYTLVIDESISILEKSDFSVGDLNVAIEAGYISCDDMTYSLTEKNYKGEALLDIFSLMKTRELVRISENDNPDEGLYYWTLPSSLLQSFKDVYILTYLFEGQNLCHYMAMNHMEYETIGVRNEGNGKYVFCDAPGSKPEYLKDIKNLIHIYDKEKMLNIGNSRTALSKNWFTTNPERSNTLKKHIWNFFNNVWRNTPKEEKMWSTFNESKSKLKGKGYTNGFLVYNAKATNEYRNKTVLVYATNIYMNVGEKTYYYIHGITPDEDRYALSIMIQWIWRSAIRDGKEIHIYIPSKRMRTLLIDWINGLTEEEVGNSNEKLQ